MYSYTLSTLYIIVLFHVILAYFDLYILNLLLWAQGDTRRPYHYHHTRKEWPSTHTCTPEGKRTQKEKQKDWKTFYTHTHKHQCTQIEEEDKKLAAMRMEKVITRVYKNFFCPHFGWNMNTFQSLVPSPAKLTPNATHYMKLGTRRQKSSKCNNYIISLWVMIKAVIV